MGTITVRGTDGGWHIVRLAATGAVKGWLIFNEIQGEWVEMLLKKSTSFVKMIHCCRLDGTRFDACAVRTRNYRTVRKQIPL